MIIHCMHVPVAGFWAPIDLLSKAAHAIFAFQPVPTTLQQFHTQGGGIVPYSCGTACL